MIRLLLSLALISLLTNSVISQPSDSLSLGVKVPMVESFNVQEATQEYLDQLTGEEKERSDAYFEGGYWLLLWGILVDAFVVWIFMAKGVSQKIKAWVTKITAKVNLQNFIYLAIYFPIAYLLAYPFTLYEDFFREHQYELSNQTFGAWMGDEITGLTLIMILASLFFMTLYIAIRKVGKAWWVWGTGVTLIFLVVSLFLGPVFISPLFNNYTPLEDGPVKESILSMARANGVPVDNVYMVDASRQSDRISANVSGIGSTIRISLNDNLLNQCSEEEVKAVMGHELGHYLLGHVQESLLYFGMVILIGFVFINWAFDKVIAKWGGNWGVNGLSDVSGFPLVMFLFSFYFFLAEPVTNGIIRSNETEADIFGLNAAREPDGFAAVSMKLSTYRKINPGYLERLIFFDHPSGFDRVSMSMEWKAEELRKQQGN